MFALEQRVEPAAQWTPMPTKSAKDCVPAAPPSPATSVAWGELAPKTVGMSIAVFSRIVFAVPTDPTSHPARVNGTHGAGAILPFSLIISGVRSSCAAGGHGGAAGAEERRVPLGAR